MKTGLKRFLGIICLLFCLATASADNIESRCPCQPKPPNSDKAFEKAYLKSSDVEIAENKILVRIDDVIIPAIALFSDDEGIYVLVKKRQGRCPDDYWECGTCGGCSPWYVPECDWCGYD